MDDDEVVITMFSLLCVAYQFIVAINSQPERRLRRWWVRDIYQNRIEFGYFNIMYKKMKERDPEEFFTHTRMDRDVYDLLLSLIKEKLTKTSIKTPINFECRLAVTLS
ncbi:hypothetical protein ABEB36_013701 [Hypothenemus hampei]|uniref:Uncharacterized protein n=1 Tax=Hypothenemus hampei TaxID=57062 RepID=A0ABD1E761_HYPHA